MVCLPLSLLYALSTCSNQSKLTLESTKTKISLIKIKWVKIFLDIPMIYIFSEVKQHKKKITKNQQTKDKIQFMSPMFYKLMFDLWFFFLNNLQTKINIRQ
jgi:hypothetical protein